MNDAVQNFERAIAMLEKRRKSSICSVVHFSGSLQFSESESRKILAQGDRFPRDKALEILIHSPGGLARYAYRLARYFRDHCPRLHALIPLQARSAGTILCLNADAIFMGELAQLGPLNAQMTDELEKGQVVFSPLDEFRSVELLGEYASNMFDHFCSSLERQGVSVKQAIHESLQGTASIMNPLYSRIDLSKLGTYHHVLAQGEEYAKRLLTPGLGEEEAAELARHLVWDYPVHDFVIDREEASEVGLPVQALPLSDEKLLISAISGLEESGISYLGFIPDGTRK